MKRSIEPPKHICGHDATDDNALSEADPCETCCGWGDGYRETRVFAKWKKKMRLLDFDESWGTQKMRDFADAKRVMKTEEAFMYLATACDVTDVGVQTLQREARRAFRTSEKLSSPLWWLQAFGAWHVPGLTVLQAIFEADKECFLIFALDPAPPDNSIADVYLRHLYKKHDLTKSDALDLIACRRAEARAIGLELMASFAKPKAMSQ
jgi:hypothetical protein